MLIYFKRLSQRSINLTSRSDSILSTIKIIPTSKLIIRARIKILPKQPHLWQPSLGTSNLSLQASISSLSCKCQRCLSLRLAKLLLITKITSWTMMKLLLKRSAKSRPWCKSERSLLFTNKSSFLGYEATLRLIRMSCPRLKKLKISRKM